MKELTVNDLINLFEHWKQYKGIELIRLQKEYFNTYYLSAYTYNLIMKRFNEYLTYGKDIFIDPSYTIELN